MNVMHPPQPLLDKRGEPRVRRFEEQRWLIDNIIRANGIDWDQSRSLYLAGPCGNEANADFAGIRERVKKMADIGPAFEAVARRREAKANAAEEAGHKVTARDNYFMAAVHWGAAQWPYDQNDEPNIAFNNNKRACYGKYAALADHRVEAVWVPFRDKAIPAWFHLPPGYSGGRIPAVIAIPGMDSFKEISVALYGDRFLNRGMAVLAIDGPGQYEAPLLGLYFSMESWMAAGKPLVDWLSARPEIAAERIGASGTSFGTFFGTILAAHEPRIRAFAAMSVCHEPGCHTIFQEASPTFKKRFMYMSGMTDEAEFDALHKTITWEGHAEKISAPYLVVAGECEEAQPHRAFGASHPIGQGPQADGCLRGVAPFGGQRPRGQSRPLPADPRGGLARGPARRQAVRQRALVRARERPDRQGETVKCVGWANAPAQRSS
jgi:dienelactone hydrolase